MNDNQCTGTLVVPGGAIATCKKSAGHNQHDPEDHHTSLYNGHLILWKDGDA